MSVIAHEDKGPACNCGSRAVMDERKHAANCTRRLWTERNDARIQLQGAVEAERTRIVELLRREAESFDDAGGVLTRLADHIATGGQ